MFFKQQIELQKANNPTSQPQHINSILLDKIKQKELQDRQQPHVLQQSYNTGQLPALIHHHPQHGESDSATVPTTQVC